MNTRRSIAITGATALAIALPLLAAERLAVKTGLWESSFTMSMSMPPEVMKSVPAAQRAQMEAMMSKPTTMTDKSCMTEKDLDEKGFRDSMQQPGMECDYKTITATSKRQEFTMQCKSAGGPVTGRVAVDVLSDSQVRGSMEMRSAQANVDAKFESKWVAAACGDVKPR
jgi:hypothetical protein